MGCPKEFSVKGGMGVALMADLEKAKTILSTLVNGVNCPITCKVRVLPDLDTTIAVCQSLAETGIAAIGVHGRTRDERPQHANRNNYIRAVANALSIPVIAKYVQFCLKYVQIEDFVSRNTDILFDPLQWRL